MLCCINLPWKRLIFKMIIFIFKQIKVFSLCVNYHEQPIPPEQWFRYRHDSAHSRTHYRYLLQHWASASKHQDIAALLAEGMQGGISQWSRVRSADSLWAPFVFVVMLREGLWFLLHSCFHGYHGETFLIQKFYLKSFKGQQINLFFPPIKTTLNLHSHYCSRDSLH